MKTKILISLLGLLLIAGAFGEGCEEEEEPKPDYINVAVDAEGYILLLDNPSSAADCPDYWQLVQSQEVRIEYIKAGGENFVFFDLIDGSCEFYGSPASFKLYREQPIDVKVTLVATIPGYTMGIGTLRLPWSQVYPSKDFGETYSWNPRVSLICYKE